MTPWRSAHIPEQLAQTTFLNGIVGFAAAGTILGSVGLLVV